MRKWWRRVAQGGAISALSTALVFGTTSVAGSAPEPYCTVKPFYSATGWHQAGQGWINASQCDWHYRLDYWGLYNNQQYQTEAFMEWWVEPDKCEPRIAPGIDGRGATVYFVPTTGTCIVRWDSKIVNNGEIVGEMRVMPYGYNKAGREVYVRESITAGSTWYRVGN